MRKLLTIVPMFLRAFEYLARWYSSNASVNQGIQAILF